MNKSIVIINSVFTLLVFLTWGTWFIIDFYIGSYFPGAGGGYAYLVAFDANLGISVFLYILPIIGITAAICLLLSSLQLRKVQNQSSSSWKIFFIMSLLGILPGLYLLCTSLITR